MVKFDQRRQWFGCCVLLCLILMILTNVGCEPLRKKFRREKRKDPSNEFIPVLEPVDYAPKMQSPDEQYRYHFSMWQIWQRDFLSGVEGNASGVLTEKNQKYLLNQIIVQLEGMHQWLNEEKQNELKVLISDVYELLKEYDKPAPMRALNQIRRSLERNGRSIREKFKPVQVSDYLRQ